MDPAFSWSRANHVRLPWQASRSREDLAVKELITHWLRKREDESAACGASGDLSYSSAPDLWMVNCKRCLSCVSSDVVEGDKA